MCNAFDARATEKVADKQDLQWRFAMKKIAFVLGILLLVLVACGPGPDDVAAQLEQAANAHDLETALDLFAEDAVLNIAGESYSGASGIRDWLAGLYADDFHIEVDDMRVEGNVAVEHDRFTVGSLEDLGIAYLEGTSEITVQDGQITAMAFTYSDESQAALDEAMLKAIILSRMELINSGQLEAWLESFADDAVEVINMRPLFFTTSAGKESIAERYEELVAGGFRVENTGPVTVAGNEVTVPQRVNAFAGQGLEWAEGMSTYVLQDGLIVRHTWTMSDESVAALREVITESGE